MNIDEAVRLLQGRKYWFLPMTPAELKATQLLVTEYLALREQLTPVRHSCWASSYSPIR